MIRTEEVTEIPLCLYSFHLRMHACVHAGGDVLAQRLLELEAGRAALRERARAVEQNADSVRRELASLVAAVTAQIDWVTYPDDAASARPWLPAPVCCLLRAVGGWWAGAWPATLLRRRG
jgi:hypothetical protein